MVYGLLGRYPQPNGSFTSIFLVMLLNGTVVKSEEYATDLVRQRLARNARELRDRWGWPVQVDRETVKTPGKPARTRARYWFRPEVIEAARADGATDWCATVAAVVILDRIRRESLEVELNSTRQAELNSGRGGAHADA